MFFSYLPTLADLAGLGAILLVLGLLHCLGTALATTSLGGGTNLLTGWAAAALALTIGGVLGLSLTPMLIVVAVLAAAAGWIYRDQLALDRLWPVLLAMAPLLLIIAPKEASEVDDFAHWIPNAADLYDTDRFRTADSPTSASFKVAYPLNAAYIMVAASRLVGSFLEASGVLLNTFLLATLALLLIRQWRGRDFPVPLGVAALGVLGATALNPTFVLKITITGYADFTTGVVLAGFAVVGAELVRRAGDTTAGSAPPWRAAIEAGLLLSMLVNIKQTNVVLAALGIVALFVLVIFEGRSTTWRFIRALPALIGLPVAAYLVWRLYLTTGISFGENKIAPFAQWNLNEIPEIIGNMLNVLAHKGGMTGLAILTIAVGGIAAFRRRFDETSRLAFIAGILFLGNTAFLGFIYVAHFNPDAGANAQSFWRYSTQIGPVLLVAAAAVFGRFWRDHPIAIPRWGAGVAIAAVVIAPIAMAPKIRFDLDPPLPYMQAMAYDVDRTIPENGKLLIVVLKDDGLQATVMRLRTWRATRDYHVLDNDTFQPSAVLDPQRPNYAWFYCASDLLRTRFQVDLPKDGASLIHYSDGQWRLMQTWPYPLPPDVETGHRKFRRYGCQL